MESARQSGDVCGELSLRVGRSLSPNSVSSDSASPMVVTSSTVPESMSRSSMTIRSCFSSSCACRNALYGVIRGLYGHPAMSRPSVRFMLAQSETQRRLFV